MSKVRVSIELGSVMIDNLTLAELSELYEELGAFFGNEECGCEEDAEGDEQADVIEKWLKGLHTQTPSPQAPTHYPWDKLSEIYGTPVGGWIRVDSTILDNAGIPYFGD